MTPRTTASRSGALSSKLEEYEVLEKIGRGKYAQVFLAVHMPTQERVVLKILNPVRNAKFKREIDVLRQLQGNAHVMKLRDVLNNPVSRMYTIVS